MRLEQLTLRIPDEEFRLRFHPRLTVLSGIGVLERRALLDSLLSSLTGGAEATELLLRDGGGRRVAVSVERGQVRACAYEDGAPAPTPLELLDRDAADLRSLMLLSAADLGLHGTARRGEPADLAEARASLAAVTDELQTAYSARQGVDAMRDELAAIDERVRRHEEDRARRRYARLLADLERVRAEASALSGGRSGVDSDRGLLTAAEPARGLARTWREAAEHVRALSVAFDDLGAVERLDPRTLSESATAPDEVPAGIDDLVAAVEDAERERVERSVRLREMAASRLAEPSTPVVVELARQDQDALWAAGAAALATASAVRSQALALGGLPSGPGAAGATDEIERQHGEVVQAEESIGRGRVAGLLSGSGGLVAGVAAAAVAPIAAPVVLAGAAGAAGWLLLRPKHRLAQAQRREQEALAAVGAPTYLSFHMRRVDAIIDPRSRQHLELAELEHRVSMAAWSDLAGDVDPGTAAALEEEVRTYAAALRDLGGAAEEIEALRRALVERVEPAAAAARAALLEVCAPFGVDDPFLAAELVRHQVGVGRVARLQLRLEAAERQESGLRAQLEAMLGGLGFTEGELSARVGAFEWAITRAGEREQGRSSARDVSVVEAELATLSEEARRSRRPEWVGVTPAEADGPSLEQLLERREATASAHAAARLLVPDVDRLADRHAALGRRVAVLESTSEGGDPEDPGDTEAVRQYLLARLTQARGARPESEAVPVVLDDALARLSGDAKWELLDLLERCSEKCQLVYLTDDPYVGAWARRRAAADAITLLEPISESV